MGAHHYDIALWALDLDHSSPVHISPPDNSAAEAGATFEMPNGVTIEHGGPAGCEFFGENGRVYINRGQFTINPESLIKEPLGKEDVKLFQSPAIIEIGSIVFARVKSPWRM